MSLNPYPKYKASGIKGLQVIPDAWTEAKLGHLTTKIGSGKTPGGGAETYVDEGVVFLRSQNIYNDGIRLKDVAHIGNDVDKEMSTTRVLSDDILLNITGASLGRTCLVPPGFVAANVNQHVCIIRLRERRSAPFVSYAMQSNFVWDQMQVSQTGAAREGLNFVQVGRIGITLPPSPEQRVIVEYLDREIAEIDAFIADQVRLVALLDERRTATITQAITKGLNPDVPMKDSGVEWLGLVPKHWSVNAIKHFTLKITDGAHISPETEGGISDFVSTKDVSDSGIDFEGSLKTSPETYSYMVKTGCQPQEGDVLFSKDGTVGRTVVVRESHDFVVASSLIIIRPDHSRLDSTYLDFLCRSAAVQEQVRSFVKGAGLPRLSIANLLKIVGVFPPLHEQQSIVEYLNNELSIIDVAVCDAREATALSKERRAALISAVVTGKVDVRGVQAPAVIEMGRDSLVVGA